MEGKGMGAVANSGVLAIVLLLGLAVGYLVAQFRLEPKLRLYREQLAIKERSMEELRHDLSEDKKTNRKLRYRLAQQSKSGTNPFDHSDRQELDEALTELQKLNTELAMTQARLAERDDAMRVARVTIQEIRQQIERSTSIRVAHGTQLAPSEAEFVDERLASLEDVTGEINLQR